jgi:glutamine synthetase
VAQSFAERYGLVGTNHLDRLDDVEAMLAESGVHTVLVSMCDVSGASRVKAVPVGRFRQAAEDGVGYQSGVLSLDFAADFVSGTGYGFEAAGRSFLLFPDCGSVFLSPWSPGTAVAMADPYFADGSPALAAPRLTLRRVLEQLDARGLAATWGWEFEFYTFRRENGDVVPTTPDGQALHQIRYRQAEPLVDALRQNLAPAGLELTDMIHEYGPGQLEINFDPAAGLYGVDRAFFFRLAVKEILRGHGVIASFMTKPLLGRAASGCHTHVSLAGPGGLNLFSDPADPEGVSALLRSWVGGQIRHAHGLTALVTPTLNGYKRYAPNSFAPWNVSWGFENRTTMIRIPLDRGTGTRVESRLPEAATNPYVAAAGLLAAGMLGLDEGADDLHLVRGNAYAEELPRLPASLSEALAALRADSALSRLLGDEFLQLYLGIKDNEIRRFRAHVTDWEQSEYLELA